MSKVNRKKIELDAAGKTAGRIATEVAKFLMGKHKVSYVAYRDLGDKIAVKNADKMIFTGKKLEQKVFRHHSMYPGGLKEIPIKKIFKEAPEQILLHAVEKMLPKNKLRVNRMKRIKFVK